MTTAVTAPIPYASPAPAQGRPVISAIALAVVGLGLIALAGCFLIGVLILIEPGAALLAPSSIKSGERFVLEIVLYCLSFASISAAVPFLYLGGRRLVQLAYK